MIVRGKYSTIDITVAFKDFFFPYSKNNTFSNRFNSSNLKIIY